MSPAALRNVSLTINAGEKVGIAGRTARYVLYSVIHVLAELTLMKW